MKRPGKAKFEAHATAAGVFPEISGSSLDNLDTSFNTERFFSIPTEFDRVTANAKHLLPDEKSIPPLTA